METPELAVLNWQLTVTVAGSDLDMIAFHLLAVLWEMMPCMCSHELNWVGGLAPQDPLPDEKFEKTAGRVARLMERPLCFMRETGAPGLHLEPSKDAASCFGCSGCLPLSRCSSGDCAGGRVADWLLTWFFVFWRPRWRSLDFHTIHSTYPSLCASSSFC